MKKRMGQGSWSQQLLAQIKCWCGWIVPGIALALIATSAIAQPPADDWKKLELPTVDTPVAPPSDRAAEKIQEALEGDAPVSTGDGMLDDVLSIIRRRGSVLDGSVLDSEIDPLADAVSPHRKAAGAEKDVAGSLAGPAASFRLAEQLLATARRLERTIPAEKAERTPRIVTGDDRAKSPAEMLPVESLVYQMRLRAVELMQSGLKASRE